MPLAEVDLTPGKRFAVDFEDLGLADLNAMGSPIMQLTSGSIGTDQFIYQDVFDIINDAGLGIRVDYTLPTDFSVPGPANGLYHIALNIPVPEAQFGQAIRVSEPIDPTTGLPADINVQFLAVANAGSVTLSAYVLATPTTIPAGTVVTIIIFSPKRLIPGQGDRMLALVASPDDTGFIAVTPGYAWQDGEAITTDKLDGTCQPSAAVADASVGKRELDPDAILRIAGDVVGGTLFNGKTPTAFTLNDGLSGTFDLVVAGAVTGQVPVIASGVGALVDLYWGGAINTNGHVQVVMKNVGGFTRTIPKGTPFQGRLLG